MNALGWSIPISFAVGAVAYSLAIYEVEAVKQEAFMMKACVDAGHDWRKSWNNRPICERLKTK